MWSELPQLPAPEIDLLPDTIQHPVLVNLSDYRLIVITGPDGEKFLQGQTTCDFRRLEQHEWLRGAHCNAKGRMHSTFVAAKIDDQQIGLRVHASIAESALKALQKYIVFSKAEARVHTALLVGVLGDAAEATLPFSLPDVGHCDTSAGFPVLKLEPNATEIWLLDNAQAGIPDQLPGVWAQPACWQQYFLERGIAEVTAESVEELLPQELNYQLIDAVSFDKGCYTGQEIVARMHYRAKLKKHLYLAEADLSADSRLEFGVDVVGEKGNVGKVINATRLEQNRWRLLALVQDDATRNSAHLAVAGQPILTWKPLPYAIPNESS
ncbi:YgfZ/GcvT domain-containing protein [Teredinibacter turnerae]|uniref:CAF17-like 4Fe-4S cluster assembly/insertion protein YgfZ n=1 Tax=Teredinibacter turnerae TaxID=2426 RepID=UPI0003742249|nr:folate-binding protein YgfZ [Teredinibacter turnerae]